MDIRIEFLAVEDEITRKQVPDTVIVSCTGEGHSAFLALKWHNRVGHWAFFI